MFYHLELAKIYKSMDTKVPAVDLFGFLKRKLVNEQLLAYLRDALDIFPYFKAQSFAELLIKNGGDNANFECFSFLKKNVSDYIYPNITSGKFV